MKNVPIADYDLDTVLGLAMSYRSVTHIILFIGQIEVPEMRTTAIPDHISRSNSASSGENLVRLGLSIAFNMKSQSQRYALRQDVSNISHNLMLQSITFSFILICIQIPLNSVNNFLFSSCSSSIKKYIESDIMLELIISYHIDYVFTIDQCVLLIINRLIWMRAILQETNQ